MQRRKTVSVDALACLLFQNVMNLYRSSYGEQLSPYWDVDANLTLDYRFKPNHFVNASGWKLSYLVSRLDGDNPNDVSGIIQRSLQPDMSGDKWWVMDDDPCVGVWSYMQESFTKLQSLGFTNLNPTPFVNTINWITNNGSGIVMGYTSFGNNAGRDSTPNPPCYPNMPRMPQDYVRNLLTFQYTPGAMFNTIESFNGYSFSRANQGQALIQDFTHMGGTGGECHVFEPFAYTIALNHVFLPAYAMGYSLVDAAYQSIPYIAWQSCVVGDPLSSIARGKQTLTQNQTWSGTNLVTGMITVPNGRTLTIASGSTIKFKNNAGLTVYGQLIVAGTSTAPVTFTSFSPTSTWSGILLYGSGANNSALQYATVQNVSSTGGSAVSVVGATGVSVQHCTISNNGTILTHGLSFSNAGSPEVAYNVINSNAGYGIWVMSTNGNIYANTVSSNTSGGVYCSNASPSFGKNGFPAYYGNNNITGGSYGVNIQANSYPYIGSQQTSYYGYNAISGNSIARVYVNSSCGALAEQNWWGSSSPNPSWFQITNGCLDWQPYLTSDPFQQYNSPKGGSTPPTTTSLQDSSSLYRQAFEKRIAGDHAQAKGLLKAIFSSRPSSPDALQAAIGLLYLYRENNDTDVFDFVQRGWQQHRANDPAFTLIVAKMLAQQSNVTETVSLLNRVASRNPNSEYAKQALLDLFYVYITRPHLHSLLPQVLQALQASYADDTEVQQAIWLYDRIGNSSYSPLQRSGEHVRSNIQPYSFDLSQNYPNPFNPTTTIRFHIPEASNVSLKLYDLLGREVATLVHEVRNAGSYDEMFDASQLASGVYIYKLAAGNFTASMKLLLVK